MHDVGIVASGLYIPEKIVENRFFIESQNNPYLVYVGVNKHGEPEFKETRVQLTEEKIRKNTGGIETRAYAESLSLVDLIERAFREATFPAESLEGIIVATVSDETRFPSVACRVQDRIKAENVSFTEDIVAACSGFTHALDHAWRRSQHTHGYYLVAGAEILSSMVDYTELNCTLFGDGCGLVVIGPAENGSRIIDTTFGSDASGVAYIYRDKKGKIRMPEGPRVFVKATEGMAHTAHVLLDKNGLKKEEIDKYFPHQANGRILDAIEERIDPSKKGRVYRTVHKYGNMSAATVPVAFAEAIKEKKVVSGNKVILTDVGSGLTLGGALIQI